MNTISNRRAGRAAILIVVMTMVMVGFGLFQQADAHTPSGGADCEKGVWAQGTNYESRDTNTLTVGVDGVTKSVVFATNGYLSMPIPQDGVEHTYYWKVSTTNQNPAFKKYGSGKITCGELPPYDECADLPGAQPQGFQCTPLTETKRRDYYNTDCSVPSVTTHYQVSTREQYWDGEDPGNWLWGDWSAWLDERVEVRPATAEECPVNPPNPPVVVPPLNPEPQVARIRIRTVKNCDPKLGDVYVGWKKNVKRVHFTRLNKYDWRITAFAADGALFKRNHQSLRVILKSTQLKNQRKCTTTS